MLSKKCLHYTDKSVSVYSKQKNKCVCVHTHAFVCVRMYVRTCVHVRVCVRIHVCALGVGDMAKIFYHGMCHFISRFIIWLFRMFKKVPMI